MRAPLKAQPPRTVEQLQADRRNLATVIRRLVGQIEIAQRTGSVSPAAREVIGMAQRTLRQAGCE